MSRPAHWVFCVVLWAPATGVEGPEVGPVEPANPAAAARDDEVSDLVSRLRNPKLSIDEREALEARLLQLGLNGARALSRVVEERFHKVDERARKAEKVYLAGLERAARKLVETRLDRAGLAEIEKLRKQVAGLRADAALTKDRVHAEGDPARKRLSELLTAELADATRLQGELAQARESLSDDFHALETDFALWERCNAGLPEARRSKDLADPKGRWPALAAEEEWRCLTATPMSDGDRTVLEKNRDLARELPAPEEALGVQDLNRLRILVGLNALLIDPKLCNAARDHSNDMRTLGFFDHQSPVEGKRTPFDRASRAGTSASAENIAAGQATGADANLGWWYSPGHHKNMLGSFSRIGLGKSGEFWTQMFG
jgi:hypothetical protein